MEQNVLEGNKLIAEFMQLHKSKYNQWCRMDDLTIVNGEEFAAEWFNELKYHSLWDWLMPACKKWNDLYFDVLENKAYEEHKLRCESLNNFVSRYDIKAVFHQLSENIKWYNNQNQNNGNKTAS